MTNKEKIETELLKKHIKPSLLSDKLFEILADDIYIKDFINFVKNLNTSTHGRKRKLDPVVVRKMRNSGMTQLQIANILNTTPSTVSRTEKFLTIK